MTDTKEKREYYDDRSLKSVYSVDDQGRKQGLAITYAKNSDQIILKEDYVNGLIDGVVEDILNETKSIYEKGSLLSVEYANGTVEKYEKDQLVERVFPNGDINRYESGKLSYTLEEGKERRYKDGLPYDGEFVNKFTDGYSGEEKYFMREGKLEGEYHYIKGRDEFYAHFKNGTLEGAYKMPVSPYYFPREQFIDMEKELNIKAKEYIADGEFHNGKFTGKVYYDNWNFYRFENGEKMEEHRYFSGVRRDGPDLPSSSYTYIKNKDGSEEITEWREKYDSYIRIRKSKTLRQHLTGDGRVIDEVECKDYVPHGIYKKFNPKGWVEVEAQYQEGKLHGVYKELNSDGTVHAQKYYENGVDMTQKREALQRIAERKIQKEEKLEAKKLPEVIEKLGKAQIKFDSKIEAAFAVKKAQKEGRK